MNDVYLNGILIVEGKQDKAFLSNFIKTPILTLNGLDITSNTISILKKYSKEITFILLADPDEAGKKIKENIAKNNISVAQIELENNKSVRGSKHGVAECDEIVIVDALKPFISAYENYRDSDIDEKYLYEMKLIGANSSYNRKTICKYLGVAPMNGKEFKSLLRILKIKKEEISKILKEHGNQ